MGSFLQPAFGEREHVYFLVVETVVNKVTFVDGVSYKSPAIEESNV